MDKLTKSKKAEVTKMSDARLISKLTQAGYSSEQIETMNREALMSTWAEVIVAAWQVEILAPRPLIVKLYMTHSLRNNGWHGK